MRARGYASADAGTWDEFVRRHPHGTPFHLTAWKKSIEETFGYRSFYLAVEDGAGLRGVLPLFLVSNRIIGKALISSPFAVYGGMLADSAEAATALKESVQALGCSLDVDYVELRNGSKPRHVQAETRRGRGLDLGNDPSQDPSHGSKSPAKPLLHAAPRDGLFDFRGSLRAEYAAAGDAQLPIQAFRAVDRQLRTQRRYS
jgi:hypothetical protein